MPEFIPCGGSYDIRYRVNIDGVAYDIRTRWNNRSESWFMYFGLSDQTPLFKTRVVGGRNLLQSYQGIEGVPSGFLFMVDVQKETGRATFEEFGINTRFRILYASDLNDLASLFETEEG